MQIYGIMKTPMANFIFCILGVTTLNFRLSTSAFQAIGSCDFEVKNARTGNNLCGYTHGSADSEDFFNWQLENGGGGNYMNVKTEEHTPGQKARLYSVDIHQQDTHCVTFQYHMEGGKTGNATGTSNSLNVYIVDISHSQLLLPVWQSMPGGYGSGWTTVQLALSKWAYKIVFEAEVKDTSPGVIALDNIIVNNEACDSAPYFLRVTNKIVNEGQNVSLDCLLRGRELVFSDDNSSKNSTKVVLQRANGDEIKPFSQKAYDDHLSVNFRFPKIQRNDEDDYRCISRTAVSVGVSNYAEITVKIPPVPQGPPEVKTPGSTHLKINLNTDKYVGDGPIVQTILNYRPVEGSWSDVHEIKETEYHLWHLKPDTEYEMTVTLIRPGEGGAGVPGPPLNTKTTCGIPLSSVEKIELKPINTSQIRISWQDPDFSITQCHYHAYVIKYRKYSGDESSSLRVHYKTMDVMQDVNFAIISGLNTYTTYQFIIELVNSKGSVESGNYTVLTGEGVPGPVPKDSFFVISTNDTSISVNWDIPEAVNGELICYEVAVRGLSSFQPDFTPQQEKNVFQFKAPKLNGTLYPLHPGTNYTMSIRAKTNAGFGPPVEITASTAIAAPIMPVYPSPTPDNGTFSTPTTIQIDILPADANGAPISNYYIVIEEIPSGGAIAQPSEKVARSRNGSKSNKRRRKNRNRHKRQIVIDTGKSNSVCHSDPISFEESKKQNKTFYFGGKLSPDSVQDGIKFLVGQGSDSGGFSNPPLNPNKRYNIYIRVDSKIGNDTRINCSLVAIKASAPPTTPPSLSPTTLKTTTIKSTTLLIPIIDTTSSGVVVSPVDPGNSDEQVDDKDKVVLYASVGSGIFLILILVIIILVVIKHRRKGKSKQKDEVVNPFEVRMMMSDIPATANGHSLARSGASGDRQALMMPDVVEDYLEKTFDPTGTRMGTYRSGSSPLAEDRPALRVDDFHIHVNEMKRQNNSGFHEEFTSFREGQTASWDIGKKEENRGKNRYGNIMAYDHSRVILQPIKGDEDQIQSDYINANYVIGYKTPSMYIAAQAPAPDTVNDFWKMIWQEKCPVIVMVTNLVELGKRKCDKYWPDERGQYGTISVALTDSEELCDYCIRTFVIQHADGYNDAREIKQFHFTTWPDHGVPTRPTNILSFVRRIKSYEPPGPTVVHCSAGSGRTGCYIVIDMMLDMARDEGVIDIYNTVTDLRSRRVNMVQTEEQYIFIHDAILEALLCGDTLVPANQLRQHYDDLITVDQQTQIAPVQEEFETLNVMTPKLSEEECSVARLPRNRTRNRFMDVLPADRQMPYLVTPHPSEPDSNYINAVFADSYTKRNAFIVSQMPLPSTVIDIWRLIYDYNCTSIIMMNDASEHDKSCAQYWPDNGSLIFGPFSVELVKKDDEVDVVSRLFKLQHINRPSEGFRLVQQFQLTNWPATQPVPYTRNAVLRVIQLVTKWQSECTVTDGRMLVHCVAGAGRSGTFVACYNMCLQLRHEIAVDVFNIVQLLRNIRPQLVETLEQYRFCYEVGWDFADQLQ